MTRLLAAETVTKRFQGLTAVDAVSFGVDKGEILAIIGPNGAGKTTLFNLLTGQLAPTDGRVLFGGRDIGALPPHLRAKLGLGRTFQIAKTLTSLTTLENAMVGAFLRHRSLAAAERAAMAVLQRVGLGARAHVSSGALTLSERRRLEVARALATEPEIILLDEVMAGLNPAEIDAAIQLFRDLHGDGHTFLVIEHNLKVVRAFSQRVLVLDHGSLIASGTPDEVLSNPQVIEAYIGRKRQ
jgi:branched-chain amino acid transport system ATP-binding protein